MTASLCQQHCNTVFQKKNEEQILHLKLKRDLSHRNMQHIITQIKAQAGHQHLSFMETLMGKGQGFDLMSKQNVSYSLYSGTSVLLRNY